MKETKVDEKNAKIFDDFFESENLNENQSPVFVNNSNLLTLESEEYSADKRKILINLLKQIFLFLPGTFLLYVVGFIGTIIFLDIFIFLRPLETLPSNAPFQIVFLAAVGFLGIFMTWFGLGDLKNKKHLSIPASIIFTGAIIAIIARAIESIFGGRLVEEFDHYFIYLLPLILIIPVLVKGWFDKETK